MNMMRRLIACFIAIYPSFAQATVFHVQEEYIELHTGPGVGYPIFHVLERGQTLSLIKQRNDWYQVQGAGNVIGWINDMRFIDGTNATRVRQEVDMREVSVSAGTFGGDSIYSARFAYRYRELFIPGIEFARSIGAYSSSTMLLASVQAELFRFSRITPYLRGAAGLFRNSPQQTLVGQADTSSGMISAGGGFKFEFARHISFSTGVSGNFVQAGAGERSSYFGWLSGLNIVF